MSMTESRSLARELPHTPATVVDAVTEHAFSEITNDAAVILPTVSTWDQTFAVMAEIPGEEPYLACAFTADEVREYYIAKVEGSEYAGGEHRHAEVHTRWYEFIDTWAKTKDRATGEVSSFRMAVLFPTWTDGIVGEICWVTESNDDEFLDLERLRGISHQLNAYDEAWRSGDVDARLAIVEDRTASVIRVKNLDGERGHRFVARSKDELRAAWTAPEEGRLVDFERLHHVVGNYYVFACYRTVVELGERHAVRETARILPLGPTGRFVGELTYSFESDV